MGIYQMCVLGDFNEDILMGKKTLSYKKLSPWVLSKWLKNLHVIAELLLIMCV